MRSTVPIEKLRVGMFVADLDRPWLGTPFLLEGFLIESQDEIATLRKFCTFVYVDDSRSVGDLQKTQTRWAPEPRLTGDARLPPAPLVQRDFHKVLRTLRQQNKEFKERSPKREVRLAELRKRPVPPLQPYDQQSDIEEELFFSTPFFEELRDSLTNVAEALRTDGMPDFAIVKENISEVVRSIQRNPDAAIWLTRLRTTDNYTYDHSLDVSVHIVVFGRFLGMPEKTLEMLGFAALMLDVGKSRITPEILTKSGPLESAEFELVKAHVADSLNMYESSGNDDPDILQIIAQHHERYDGSGYPNGISGEKISLHAEMAGIIDTYCAMIRQRAYRAPISTQRGLEHLVKTRGTQFRDLFVDQFIQCIGIYPVGSIVELNSGEVAVVVAQNQVRRLKPRVMILLGPDKTPDRRPRTLDLIYDPANPTGEPYRIVKALPSDAYGIDPKDFFLA
jgi:HD-GYP domain-containing protein (c-di-GMP phosphodiesterase class II)